MNTRSRKLNLGCGKELKLGFENYDSFPIDKRVKTIDLNKLPLPFENNSIDYILLNHTYEHLMVNRLDFMREIHRILKIDGVIEIKTPSYNPSVAHTIWFMPLNHFDTICTMHNDDYIGFTFEKLGAYRINGDKYSSLFNFFPFLAKMFPYMTSGEIVFKLKKRSI